MVSPTVKAGAHPLSEDGSASPSRKVIARGPLARRGQRSASLTFARTRARAHAREAGPPCPS